ncbi:MAG: glutathione S-transferase family protein [Alphaproteobacteria bacterium]|nr:glutathione S-transferase family protein [Alphaproteobacteria bacterium]
MITVWGEGRGFRVIWLLEEMGLPYRLRGVDLLKGAENDPEFMAINPGGFIPALVDGDATMVESIAIMEYLLARYGQQSKSATPLAPAPNDPDFAMYQQFLHLGEAGLGASIQVVVVSGFVAPEAERDSWGARWALNQFQNRRKLLTRQLAKAPYVAGDRFTAADISVTYTLNLAGRRGGIKLDDAEKAYMARTTGRDGYKRTLDACPATKGFYASVPML